MKRNEAQTSRKIRIFRLGAALLALAGLMGVSGCYYYPYDGCYSIGYRDGYYAGRPYGYRYGGYHPYYCPPPPPCW